MYAVNYNHSNHYQYKSILVTVNIIYYDQTFLMYCKAAKSFFRMILKSIKEFIGATLFVRNFC